MNDPSRRKSDLGRLHANRVLLTRLTVGLVLLILLAIRMCPWTRKQTPPTTAPVSTAPIVSEENSLLDYPRYNNKTFAVVKVLDGDTIDVNIPDLKAKKHQAYTRIRLWGIDTPEIPHFGKPAMYYGYEAAEFARKLMAGKKVRLELLEGYTRDKFGRLLAYVYLPDGRMYNVLAIQEGYAYAEVRFQHPRLEEFVQLEKQARTDMRGLWPGITPDQLPHWYKSSRLDEFWSSRESKNPQPTTSRPAHPKRSRKSKIDTLEY